MLADQFRDHAVILRNLNLLMIDVKHESRYNYTELLYLMDEAFFMGAFFDWLLPNSNGIITVIVILAVAIPSLTVVRRLTKGHVSKNSCTVQTVGFIRSTRQTGLYVNENPQLLFELDALAEDGTIFQASVRKIIPITEIAGMVPGRAIPIRYNSDDRTRAKWDDHPDEALAQERAARYQCRKHPGDLSYFQFRCIVLPGPVVCGRSQVQNRKEPLHPCAASILPVCSDCRSVYDSILSVLRPVPVRTFKTGRLFS